MPQPSITPTATASPDDTITTGTSALAAVLVAVPAACSELASCTAHSAAPLAQSTSRIIAAKPAEIRVVRRKLESRITVTSVTLL
jgi:hypothetical protein